MSSDHFGPEISNIILALPPLILVNRTGILRFIEIPYDDLTSRKRKGSYAQTGFRRPGFEDRPKAKEGILSDRDLGAPKTKGKSRQEHKSSKTQEKVGGKAGILTETYGDITRGIPRKNFLAAFPQKADVSFRVHGYTSLLCPPEAAQSSPHFT